MTFCQQCKKDTSSTENKFKDIVYAQDGEYLTVYVWSCVECGCHKSDESSVE